VPTTRRAIIDALAVAVSLTLWTLSTGAAAIEPVSAILTSARSRAAYLAHAMLWNEPADLTPDELLAGPAGALPYSRDERRAGIGCTYVQPGAALGGKSAKFECAADDGRMLRLKYWEPDRASGNREVFAIVAATRLMWALGFNVLHAQPLNVHCHACPANPMTGDGVRREREYLAEISVYPPSGPLIVSREDHDQGWSWRELDDAIAALPPGPERVRQRTHFDALTLLGVLLQHGDRKPEQQALYCDGPVDEAAGARVTIGARNLPAVFRERSGAPACAQPAAVLVDVGATFGGAGRTSSNETAKMDLEAWRSKTVFREGDDAHEGTCHGRLTVSLAAGGDGEGDPVISEQGRRFLLDQLHRLTNAHVRAIFAAARVNQLPRARGAASSGDAIDEWTAAFEDKVRQIEVARCQT
jgi:hypothetical protein